jgi:hypothetical protein
MVQKGEDGSLSLAIPVGQGARFPLIDIAEDTGKSLKDLFALLYSKVGY